MRVCRCEMSRRRSAEGVLVIVNGWRMSSWFVAVQSA